ncbi:unnamed protein product [Leuciscus chuanchicus]
MDNEAHINSKLYALERAVNKHKHHKVWKLIHDISEKPKDASSSKIRMLNGDIPSSSEDLLKEWANYFSTLLNNKSSKINPNNRPLPTPDIPGIKLGKITRAEIDDAITTLNRNKAPGPDYAMTAEVLKDGEKLNIFARKCYRIMLGINQAESHMTNEQLYSTTGQQPISDTRRRQHQFIGHCLRMGNNEPAQIYVLYKSEVASNRRGRPRISYRDYVYRYYEHLDLDKERLHEELTSMSKERGLWRNIVAPKKPAR